MFDIVFKGNKRKLGVGLGGCGAGGSAGVQPPQKIFVDDF